MIALAITSTAQGATTRPDWVAQVDPICANGQAQEAAAAQPLLAAAKRAKKHHNRKTARRLNRAVLVYFAQFANIERAVNAQIATITTAPDDVSLIQVWLRARGELLDSETQLLNTNFNSKNGLKGFFKFFALLGDIVFRQQEVADLVRDFGLQSCTRNPYDPFVEFGLS